MRVLYCIGIEISDALILSTKGVPYVYAARRKANAFRMIDGAAPRLPGADSLQHHQPGVEKTEARVSLQCGTLLAPTSRLTQRITDAPDAPVRRYARLNGAWKQRHHLISNRQLNVLSMA